MVSASVYGLNHQVLEAVMAIANNAWDLGDITGSKRNNHYLALEFLFGSVWYLVGAFSPHYWIGTLKLYCLYIDICFRNPMQW